MGKQAQKDNKEVGEDSTKYGEFISSFFVWKTPEQQKQIVEKLENVTGKNTNKKQLK